MNHDVESFYGLPCRRIENRHIQVDYLTAAGPRIVRLRLRPSDANLLAELPNDVIETTRGTLHMYGGHRLWHSPEDNPRTYLPDDDPVAIEETPDGVRLTQKVEAETGIEKSLSIRICEDTPTVIIEHNLTNRGLWTVELATWAITQLPTGGIIALPEPVRPADRWGLLPNRQLVLWPYTHWNDPRLRFADGFVFIAADPMSAPIKVGNLNSTGWAGYYRAGTFFLKRFDPRLDQPHPDFNCNAESFSKETFVELETLGPLTRLEAGQSAQHTEQWEIYAGLDFPVTIEGVQALVKSLQL